MSSAATRVACRGGDRPVLSGTVFAVVLLGAALHAAWNVTVRGAADRRREMALVVGGAGVISAALLPFLPGIRAEAIPFLVASGLLHVIYFALVAEAYAHGAVALAYPVMRGAAPALSALVASLVFAEALPLLGWLGVAAVCGGVLLLARRGRQGTADEAKAIRFALVNALVIAAYTVVDAAGARASGSPLAYTAWSFLAPLPVLLPWLLRGRAAPPRAAEIARGLGGGACTLGAYAAALWAMTQAPVAPVAALRETSTLFGLVLARVLLGERPGAVGWIAAGAIAAGAALLRLA